MSISLLRSRYLILSLMRARSLSPLPPFLSFLLCVHTCQVCVHREMDDSECVHAFVDIEIV